MKGLGSQTVWNIWVCQESDENFEEKEKVWAENWYDKKKNSGRRMAPSQKEFLRRRLGECGREEVVGLTLLISGS